MQEFIIEYTETVKTYFKVEADSVAEAMRRFENWRIAEPHVHDAAGNSDNFESDVSIINFAPGIISDEDTLTDEYYQANIGY